MINVNTSKHKKVLSTIYFGLLSKFIQLERFTESIHKIANKKQASTNKKRRHSVCRPSHNSQNKLIIAHTMHLKARCKFPLQETRALRLDYLLIQTYARIRNK
jgi:hypothetical protein